MKGFKSKSTNFLCFCCCSNKMYYTQYIDTGVNHHWQHGILIINRSDYFWERIHNCESTVCIFHKSPGAVERHLLTDKQKYLCAGDKEKNTHYYWYCNNSKLIEHWSTYHIRLQRWWRLSVHCITDVCDRQTKIKSFDMKRPKFLHVKK